MEAEGVAGELRVADDLAGVVDGRRVAAGAAERGQLFQTAGVGAGAAVVEEGPGAGKADDPAGIVQATGISGPRSVIL
jgi:hypothetical protein